MPLIRTSTYRARGIFRNAHINTIYPAIFRKVKGLCYERERISTRDGDFLDLDWSPVGSKKLALILHGLEGGADRPYVRGMARYFNRKGRDALGLNFRGCSGEPNRKLRSYHVGETNDLRRVLAHCIDNRKYESIVLIGFSLGGNVLLKYLGEQPEEVPPEVRAGVAFSVPCHVESANREIDRWHNWPYRQRFMGSLNAKILEKAQLFPQRVSIPHPLPRDFGTFDDVFTAPIHGFRDAQDYWAQNSSLQFLPKLARPALLVSALDDSFLSSKCYPFELAKGHSRLFLETPRQGGHVGFVSRGETYWSEHRAYEFVEEMAGGT